MPLVAATEQPDLPPDWGSLTGRVTLAGAPEPEKITVTNNLQFCGPFNLANEAIKVNRENGGLANAMVWLHTERGQEPPGPHESYAETAADEIVFDNRECRFTPRVVAIRTTQTLLIKNSDPISHNAYIPYEPAPINPNLEPGKTVEKQFPEPTRLPLIVSCSSHPWMRARIMALDTPYFAVTDESGAFEIGLLPPGKWTFQFYHEEFGFLSRVEIHGAKTRWDRGRPELEIEGGKLTDLGEVKLAYGDYQ